MGETALIGIDIGTSSVKAVMTAADGRVLARYGAPYPMMRPVSGAALQDPADWLNHAMAALTEWKALQPLIEQALGVKYLTVTNEVEAGWHNPSLPSLNFPNYRYQATLRGN